MSNDLSLSESDFLQILKSLDWTVREELETVVSIARSGTPKERLSAIKELRARRESILQLAMSESLYSRRSVFADTIVENKLPSNDGIKIPNSIIKYRDRNDEEEYEEAQFEEDDQECYEVPHPAERDDQGISAAISKPPKQQHFYGLCTGKFERQDTESDCNESGVQDAESS